MNTTNRLIGNALQVVNSTAKGESLFGCCSKRYYPAPIKRFYLNASVEKCDRGYKVNLDRRPLRTPGKTTLTLKNEQLANAVAAEWCSQKTIISPNVMHLTALCNTVQDNPLKRCKDDLINTVLDSLNHDTILYRSEENEKLARLQRIKWDPIYKWFQREFNVKIPLVHDIVPSEIPREDLREFRQFLETNNLEGLHGFIFGCDSIHSVILTTAVVKYIITAKEAVHLSRLELEYQIEHWGTVEWHHELELHDSIARLSAAALFFESYNIATLE